MEETKYYKSNKYMGLTGTFYGFEENAQGVLQLEEMKQEGWYISQIFDSGKAHSTWDELHLHFEELWELEVYVWIFDSEIEKRQYISFSKEDQFHIVKQNGYSTFAQDILLYGRADKQQGRYLIFSFHVRKPKEKSLIFTAFELSFPSFLCSIYLPYVYQNNQVLERYLSVFKDIYLDIEHQIDEFYHQLDIETCDDIYIEELLSWMGLSHFTSYASYETLRNLPTIWKGLYSYRGSASYYLKLFHFLFSTHMKLVKEEDFIHVFIPFQNKGQERKMYAFIINEFPYYVKTKIHFVKENYMDNNSFLGITSRLDKENAIMDQQYMDNEWGMLK